MSLRFPMLAEPAAEYRFDAGRTAELVALLQQQHEVSELVEISRPGELLLSIGAIRAHSQGRLRWTTQALSQLCSLLATGFAQTIQCLAGPALYGRLVDENSGFDPTLAIATINALLRSRFAKLDGYQLLLDNNSNTIIGLVGRRYELVSNFDFYTRITDFGETADRFILRDAQLSGRKLALRFVENATLFAVVRRTGATMLSADRFGAGLYFSNSEAGDCSVKASTLLFREAAQTFAMHPFVRGARVAHVRGKRFARRFEQLLEQTFGAVDQLTCCYAPLYALTQKSLELGDATESHTEQLAKLKKKLRKAGLTQTTANLICERMLLHGSDEVSNVATNTAPLTLFASRTGYDLFNSLTRAAVNLSFESREHMEQMAFGLLGSSSFLV